MKNIEDAKAEIENIIYLGAITDQHAKGHPILNDKQLTKEILEDVVVPLVLAERARCAEIARNYMIDHYEGTSNRECIAGQRIATVIEALQSK